MSRLRIVLAAVLAVSALAVLAVPATAAVPASNAKFCAAVKKVGSQSGSQPTKAQAKKLVSQFKAAAKSAPGNVKSAIGKITKYLDVIAAGDITKLADLAKSKNFQDYTKAVTTYSTYVASNCT
jgi:hypothetical protein